MDVQRHVSSIKDYIESSNIMAAVKLLAPLQAADAAEILNEIGPESARRVAIAMPPPQLASILGYLRPAMQSYLTTGLSRKHLAELFEHMHRDERADFYNRMDENERQAILPGLAHAAREDIRLLSSYPEGTVGAIMTSAYVTLSADQTATQALDTIRMEAPDAETIYQAYVLDDSRLLVGTLSLRDLLLADGEAFVRDLMVEKVIHSFAWAPRSEAARMIARYDLLALPVVNEQGQMVGIVMHDDALDVTEEESTEDQHKLGAVSRLSSSYSEAGIMALYRTRVGWLVILVFGNIFSGASLAHFEDLIARLVSLVFFLPLLIDSGGNAGSQSATLMVRALATDDVRARDWFHLLGKEILVSLLLGLSMAVAVSSIGYIRGGMDVAIVVSLTMVIIVLVGSLIGMSLPFLLTRLNLDPASASAPLVTTICDGVGVLIYFNVATLIL